MCHEESVTVLCVGGAAESVDGTAESVDGIGSGLRAVRPSFSVRTARTAREALERIEVGTVDCVLSAYALPETDGVAFLEAVRADYPVLPFVLFAAEGSEAVASAAVSAGVSEYVRRDGDTGADRYEHLADRILRAVDRARDERERREKSSQLDAVFEDLPVSIYFKDDRARHLRVSRAHATGYGGADPPEGKAGVSIDGPADFCGRTDLDLFPAENARESYEDDIRVIETGEPIENKEERISVPGGEDRWVTTTKSPWRGEHGQVEGVFGFTLDITDRKRRERQLEQQNERLEEFANVVSHDLRSPLSVVRARLDLLRDDVADDHVESIEQNLERMDTMIDTLLTMARAGKTVTDPGPVVLSEVATEAWRHADAGDCELDVCLSGPVVVRADRDRLLHVFENLFRNARDHNESPVTVRVDVLSGDGQGGDDRDGNDGEPVGFVVADDGRGIAADDRESVFDHGYTTDPDGTGFGLAIVRDIVEAHGWTVRATTGPRGGARFEVTGVDVTR